MPFRLSNAPNIFKRFIIELLKLLISKLLVYIYDVLIYSRSRLEHFVHPRKVFLTIRSIKLYINLTKCSFL